MAGYEASAAAGVAGQSKVKMIRLLVSLLLATLSATTWADWVEYGETPTARSYYDSATVARSNGRVQVWRIVDFKQPGEDGALSWMGLEEFDCEGKRYRTLYVSAYAEHMALGSALVSRSTDPSEADWHAITPQTPEALALRKKVCLGKEAKADRRGPLADWVRFAESEQAHFHFDSAAVARSGVVMEVWRVTDLKERGERGELSLMTLDEFDCKGRRYRTLSLSVHAEHMALGRTLHSHTNDPSESDWHYTEPNTPAEILLKILCK